MNVFRKSNGAVSVFLAIILVPMLALTSMYVDVSKIKLAKGVAASAGTLSLNTALTDYDTVLQDMYGLFATAQDTEELYALLEDYYRTSISSTGISDEDTDEYLQYIMSTLKSVGGDAQTSDILHMELVDFTVKKVDGANLANPAFLKEQIVEFMKYRAPINTGLSFLNALHSLINLQKETDLVDKRQKYYEAEKSVRENACEAWKYIDRYNKSPFLKDENYFKDMQTNLASYKDEYEKIHNKTIKDLFDTQEHAVFNENILTFEESEVSYNGSKIKVWMLYNDKDKKSKEKNYTELTAYSNIKKATAENLKTALEECHKAYEDAYDAKNKLKKLLPYIEGKTYGLQLVVQINRAGLYTSYVDAVKNYYGAYQRLLHAYHFKKDKAEETTGILWGNTSRAYNEYKTELDDAFEAYREKFNEAHRNINSNLDSAEKEIGDKTKTDDTDKKIKEIYNQINEYRTVLEDAKNNLTSAQDCLKKVYNAVLPGGKLDKSRNNWSASVDKAPESSSIAKQDKGEIADLKDKYNPDEVKKLIDRIDKITPKLDAMMTEIDAYTYASRSLGEIDSYKIFEYVIGEKFDDTNLKNISTIEEDIKKTAQWYWDEGPYREGNIDIRWTTTDGIYADLKKPNKLSFYNYLYTNFHKSVFETGDKENEAKDKEKTAKNNFKKTKESLKNAADKNNKTNKEAVSEVKNEISGKKDIPSKDSSYKDKIGVTPSGEMKTDNDTAASDTTSQLGNLLGTLADKLVNVGTDVRDNLYFADYVMSMFSYDTIENEKIYDGQKGEKNYFAVETAIQDAGKTEIKNLRGQSIKENYMYGGEVEYILYGGKDASNKVKSYGTVFAIRLGFNLVYAFSNAEIRNTALGIATPISAATFGVIPAPLIQAAIIIGIAIAESSIDLMYLRQGMKVPLYKNKDTWNISISSLANKVGDAAKDIVKVAANKAIDSAEKYLDSWLDKTSDELQDMGAEKIADLSASVKSSFNSVVDREIGNVTQKLVGFIEDAMEDGLETENEVVNYVDAKLDEWLKSFDEPKDSVVYKVKSEAIKLVRDKSEGIIKDVYKSISGAVNGTADDAGKKLTNKFTEITDKISDSVSKKLKSTLDAMTNEIKEAAGKGADKLKETINSKLDNINGLSAGESAKKADGLSSFLSFQYSDYLRLFLIIGLFTNEEGIVLRTADVIQVNMQQKDANFILKNASTYVSIDVTIAVKPLLMANPMFSDYFKNPKDNTNWYMFQYLDIRGY